MIMCPCGVCVCLLCSSISICLLVFVTVTQQRRHLGSPCSGNMMWCTLSDGEHTMGGVVACLPLVNNVVHAFDILV